MALRRSVRPITYPMGYNNEMAGAGRRGPIMQPTYPITPEAGLGRRRIPRRRLPRSAYNPYMRRAF